MKLFIGNKAYSSWSLRGWLACKLSGLPFEEVVVPLYDEAWEKRREGDEFAPSSGKVPILWDGDDTVVFYEAVSSQATTAIGGVVITNNLLRDNAYAIFGSGSQPGTVSLNAYTPGWIVLRNAIGGANASRYPVNNDYPTQAQWLADFTNRWNAALTRWNAQIAPLKGTPIVVQHHSWIYLERWIGLNEVAPLEPKPGVPPSSGYLAEVLTKLQATPAKFGIRAAYEDDRPSTFISEHAKIPAIALPYTVGGNAQAKDLFSLYDNTIQLLLGAVKK